jgi:uncharacterized protein (DUF983 family)
MAQIAVTERFELVRETANEIVRHQRGQGVGPENTFLDSITADLLCDSIYRKQDWVRDSGLYAVMYPREYSVKVRDRERKTAPYMQQAECIVSGNEGMSIDVEFCFLQPKIRVLRKWEPTTKGKGRWTRTTKEIDVDGKKFKKTIDGVVRRRIMKSFNIADILNTRVKVPISFEDEPVKETAHESEKIKVEYIYEVPRAEGQVTVMASKLGTPGHYKITMRMENHTIAKSEESEWFMEERVAQNCFYGTFSKIKVSGGKIVSLPEASSELKKEVQKCSNINTSPLVSTSEPSVLFASPIIMYDFPRSKPKPMSMSLSQLCLDEKTLLENLVMLDERERRLLVDSGKIKDLHKVVVALSKTKPQKIARLHAFQWAGIQLFIKKLLNDDDSPLVIRAPTDSGKSIIFYVCSVLKTLFSDRASGTVAFITFPTRALNSQQFSEMVDFFYHLGRQGARITLGLYMGAEYRDRDVAVRSYWPPDVKEGQEIADIDVCPNCGGSEILAHKPHERRMVPKCNSCGNELDFIYLSNMETEEFCPNIVVGTPDKIMNSLTTNPWAQAIFGGPCKKCPNCSRHFLLTWKDQAEAVHKCRYCSIDLGPETKTQSTPQFVVFDEVHTLSGTQGNLLGQFLSLMKVTNKRYGLTNDYWYLGATATIANQQQLIENLTGHSEQTQFPEDKEFKSYFEVKHESPRHRYLVLEPLARTTRWSVSAATLDLFSILKQANESDDKAVKELKSQGLDLSNLYKVQTIYVLRKTDGRNLEKYVPDLAARNGIPMPATQFGSGDLPRSELVSLNKKVRENKLDVLIVTQIYGQGVDFPGLNIIHFFGIPRSFIELAQVVGRTGRRSLPGLVLLHMQPEIPRDQWVYKHFRDMIANMEELYEPVPINVLNRFAVSLSLPNVLNSLVICRGAKDYKIRFADYCSKYFDNADRLRELLDDLTETYLGSGLAGQNETERLRKLIFGRVRQLLMDFRTSKYDTGQTLKLRRMLLSSLRDPSNEVPYTDSISYPILERLNYRGAQDDEEEGARQ